MPMRDWLTEEEERHEKRSAWKTRIEFGLLGAVVVLPILIAIKGWIGV